MAFMEIKQLTSACWLNRDHSGVRDIGLCSPPECHQNGGSAFSEQKYEQGVFIVFFRAMEQPVAP